MKNLKPITRIVGLGAALLLTGCAGTPPLPPGARAVGGGLQINWAPTSGEGTAILVETTTGKIIATKNVDKVDSFLFDVTQSADAQVLRAALPTLPTNAQFILYYVPTSKKD